MSDCICRKCDKALCNTEVMCLDCFSEERSVKTAYEALLVAYENLERSLNEAVRERDGMAAALTEIERQRREASDQRDKHWATVVQKSHDIATYVEELRRLSSYAEELKSRAQEAAKAIDRYLWQIKQNDAREDLKGDLQMAAQRCLMDLEDARYGIVELIELPNVAMTALSIPSSNSKPSGEPVTGAQADAAGPGGAESDAPRFDRTLDQLADWLDKKFRRHGEWCDKLAAEALRTFQATAGNLSFEGGGRVKVHDLDALVKSPRVQAQVQAVREMLDAGSFATEHGPVPVEFPGVGNTDPGPRYMVTGYGETEFPEVRMARTLDEVADAYCHLVFGQPFADVLAEAHDEADEFTRQVKDHDWAEEPVFDTWHFEIGGVKVERVYARQFGASTPSQGTER